LMGGATKVRAYKLAKMENCCCICALSVCDARNRRNLRSSASSHALPVLMEILRSVSCETGLNVEERLEGNLCCCRSCFRTMEKIAKLRESLDQSLQEMCKAMK